MVKKMVMVLLVLVLVTSGAFAQDFWNNSFKFDSGPTPQNGALFVDFSYLLAYLLLDGIGGGLGWEGKIADNSTYLISANFGTYSYDWQSYQYNSNTYSYRYFDNKYTVLSFGLEANYRFYFFKSALDKLFANVGVGFQYYSYAYEYGNPARENKTYGYGGLTIPLYVGYKLILGAGFVVEIQGGYRVGIGVMKPSDDTDYSPEYGGAIYGLTLGWAF